MNMAATFSNEMRVIHKIHAWVNPAHKKTPRLASFVAALLFHAAFFSIGGLIFIQAPHYGLDLKQGGVDVYLVAAPTNSFVPEAQVAEALTQKSEMEIPEVQPVTTVQPPAEKKLVHPAKEFVHQGDGSSSVSGESSTTFSSLGDGQTEVKPGYLKNPSPAYPAVAVQRGQEGLVLLSVFVDRSGNPQSVNLKKSSGFSLLDAAALKAVKKWKFSPGKLGVFVTEAEVTIPVRFRLQDA